MAVRPDLGLRVLRQNNCCELLASLGYTGSSSSVSKSKHTRPSGIRLSFQYLGGRGKISEAVYRAQSDF